MLSGFVKFLSVFKVLRVDVKMYRRGNSSGQFVQKMPDMFQFILYVGVIIFAGKSLLCCRFSGFQVSFCALNGKFFFIEQMLDQENVLYVGSSIQPLSGIGAFG